MCLGPKRAEGCVTFYVLEDTWDDRRAKCMSSHSFLSPQSRLAALTIRRLFIGVGSCAAPTPDRPGPPDTAALLDLPTIADGDLGRRLPAARTDRFNLLDHVVARHDLS